jgi:hypothetical protein
LQPRLARRAQIHLSCAHFLSAFLRSPLDQLWGTLASLISIQWTVSEIFYYHQRSSLATSGTSPYNPDDTSLSLSASSTAVLSLVSNFLGDNMLLALSHLLYRAWISHEDPRDTAAKELP